MNVTENLSPLYSKAIKISASYHLFVPVFSTLSLLPEDIKMLISNIYVAFSHDNLPISMKKMKAQRKHKGQGTTLQDLKSTVLKEFRKNLLR